MEGIFIYSTLQLVVHRFGKFRDRSQVLSLTNISFDHLTRTVAESSGLNWIGTMNAQLLPEPSTSRKNHKKIMEARRIGKLFLSSRSSTMKENQIMYV